MSGMKDVFGDVFSKSRVHKSLSRSSDSAIVGGLENYITESIATDSQLPVRDFDVNGKIRELFGKRILSNTQIGGHPDFDSLAKNKSISNGYVTTLFMDIKGSTRLGVIYDLEEVFYYKNTIIKCAIECIQAFDGHVHRIMGDAVLAFFRSDGSSPRDSAIDAINCGTYLVQFMKDIVQPEIQNFGLDEDIGIRIGIDYGPDEKVLWGMYGYPGVSEVTATSFHVDVAAKLQQKAPRNRVMLGQSLCDMLDLPIPIIEHKRVGGELERYVTPNYRTREDTHLNYKQYVLNHNLYYPLLPSPKDDQRKIKVTASVKTKHQIQADTDYHACSRSIYKPFGITFKATFLLAENITGVSVRFRVENTGKEAAQVKEPLNGNHHNDVPAVRRDSGEYFASHWEDASYTGLHYMYVSVWHDNMQIAGEQRFAVFIGE
jgi:class 3 adenylate cyclase